MYDWNDDWRYEMKEAHPVEYERFCDCVATKSDFIMMVSYMWTYNPEKSKEDCFDRMCDWLCSNNQFFVLDIVNYKWYADRIKKIH